MASLVNIFQAFEGATSCSGPFSPRWFLRRLSEMVLRGFFQSDGKTNSCRQNSGSSRSLKPKVGRDGEEEEVKERTSWRETTRKGRFNPMEGNFAQFFFNVFWMPSRIYFRKLNLKWDQRAEILFLAKFPFTPSQSPICKRQIWNILTLKGHILNWKCPRNGCDGQPINLTNCPLFHLWPLSSTLPPQPRFSWRQKDSLLNLF